jgi:hypothetical protein
MKIKIELTEPQYFLLREAIQDHVHSLDAIDNMDIPQLRKLNMLNLITLKLINARRGEV